MKQTFVCVLLCATASVALAQPGQSMASPGSAPSRLKPSGPNDAAPGAMTVHQSLNSAQPSPAIATGSIEVLVVDSHGEPVEGAETILAVLEQGGNRRDTSAKTNANGKSLYTGLGSGDQRAFLVRVPYQGALFRSPPFQLPADQGYEVVIRRLETGRDSRAIVLSAGQLSIWAADEGRLEVGQTARLLNTSEKAYRFPERGFPVELPKGYVGFEPSPVMGDQRLAETPGQGFAITGSLMPGTTTLSWRFALPVSEDETQSFLKLPWKIVGFRVVADASSGMTLDVSHMPRPTAVQEQERSMSMTEIELGPDDPQPEGFEVTISRPDGPGPLRWIALALSIAIVAIGVIAAARKPK